MIPQSATLFNVPGVGVQVTFVKGQSGTVTHLIVRKNGQETEAKKIQ